MKGKAFVVVGHKNWGKSRTLRAFTKGDSYKRWITIKNQEFWIRRMSNDDRPQSFFDLLEGLDSAEKPFVILTLCPTFTDKRLQTSLIKALDAFRKKYLLFFFVLRIDYFKQDRRITDDEITALERFGEVTVFQDSDAKPGKRARTFKRFILRRV